MYQDVHLLVFIIGIKHDTQTVMNDIFFKRVSCVLKRVLSWRPGPCEGACDHVEAHKHQENDCKPERNLQGREVPAQQKAADNDGKQANGKVEIKKNDHAYHEDEEDGLDNVFSKFLVMDMV